MKKELYTLKEASEMLNMHPNTLRKWDNSGILTAVRIGSRGDRRYRAEDLRRFLNKTAYVTGTEEVAQVTSVRSEYYEAYAPLLAEKAHLNSESVIVDVPSGSGGMTRALAKQGYGGTFYHVDINEHMIEEAKKVHTKTDHKFIVGDAVDLENIIPEQVDAVLCLNGFHIYIDDKRSFLNGCKKILKDTGTLIFDVSTRGLRDAKSRAYLDAQSEELNRLAKEKNIQLNMPALPDDETFAQYRSLIEEAGLELKETITFDQWKSVDQLLQETLDIKGRLRPWIPDVTDAQRVKMYTEASQCAKEKIGITKINHSRVFFVAEQ